MKTWRRLAAAAGWQGTPGEGDRDMERDRERKMERDRHGER